MNQPTNFVNTAPPPLTRPLVLPVHTYADILALDTCYDPAWPANPDFSSPRDTPPLCTPDWRGTALDVLQAKQVPAPDCLWLVLREDWLPLRLLHEFMVWCGEQALAIIPNPDPRSLAAVEAKRQWLTNQISDRELAAARAAARDAARAAAWAAARDAARAAAWAAARDAAGDAAWAAAGDAAGAAAWAAARAAAWAAALAAARDAQVTQLITMIGV